MVCVNVNIKVIFITPILYPSPSHLTCLLIAVLLLLLISISKLLIDVVALIHTKLLLAKLLCILPNCCML